METNQLNQNLKNPYPWDLQNMLVDWITLSASNEDLRWPILNDGYTISYDLHDQPQYTVERHFPIVGSYNTKAFVRIDHEKLKLTFNPSRYHRPENLFGVTYEQAIMIANNLLLEQDLLPLEEFTISRLDLTLNIETGSPENLREYLRVAKLRKLPRMRTVGTWESAIYRNTRKSLTIYDKGAEIGQHAINDQKRWRHYYKLKSAHDELHHVERTKSYCDKRGIARVELRLGRHYLIDAGLRKGQELNQKTLEQIFMKETDNVIKDIEEFSTGELKTQYIRTFNLWKAGYDPKELMSRNTYYAHRAEILEVTGIDISIHPSEDEAIQEKRNRFRTKSATIPGFYKIPFKRPEAE